MGRIGPVQDLFPAGGLHCRDASGPQLCYQFAMTKTVEDKLSDLVGAVKSLPPETQEALIEEFSDRLSDFADSGLSDSQRQEVDRRLANPRYAEAEDVSEFFVRHGVGTFSPLG